MNWQEQGYFLHSIFDKTSTFKYIKYAYFNSENALHTMTASLCRKTRNVLANPKSAILASTVLSQDQLKSVLPWQKCRKGSSWVMAL